MNTPKKTRLIVLVFVIAIIGILVALYQIGAKYMPDTQSPVKGPSTPPPGYATE